MKSVHWHALSTSDAATHHAVDPATGLSEEEAATRLVRHGPNRPTVRPGYSLLSRLLSQFAQPLVLVLMVAGAVTAILGEWVDSGVILGVVIVNAVIGFFQEARAETALAALVRAVTTESTVLRAGRPQRLDAVHLVPGDVVVLAAGDKVPADLRLLHGRELRTMEATLTGESLPVEKHADTLSSDTLLADRHNMAYAGTHVVAGHGHGLVVATADATETGRIGRMMGESPALTTPLTRRMADFAQQLLIVILGLAALTFVVGILRGESWFDMFMAAVALAVGAIPEGLPAAMTIMLAIGVSRMAKRRAIIRQLPAVETLGSTTVICSDKTGTLTENAMTVQEIWTQTEQRREVLIAGVLCNDAALHHKEGHWQIVGDPTEGALLVAAKKEGLDEVTLRSVFPRLDELPFDSARQTMVTLHEVEGEKILYLKGAVEKVVSACHCDVEEILQRAAILSGKGLRVLALARKTHVDHGLNEADIVDGFTFLGLVGMIDPPRAHAKTAVHACHAAGIRVKMITGDHAGTALAIARQIGICGMEGRALTGRELAVLEDTALARAVRDVDVFARVEPEQKLRLVRALQANGDVVAMTGDGVNDAPALKAANIGIAMGQGGTDVAKEAAAMVLTDDNFATIEAAIEEGRGVWDNLVKFITWTLPTNFGEGLVILAAILAGVTLPITPLQILWINMTTAVLLGLPLAFEPAETGIMRRPPRSPSAPVLDGALIFRIVLVGVLMLIGAFGLFTLALDQGRSLNEARTLAVNVFVMVEIFYLFNCRSLTRPFWTLGWFSNPWIWVGVGGMVILQMCLTYVPLMNRLFATVPLGMSDWFIITCFGMVSMGIVGMEKRLRWSTR